VDASAEAVREAGLDPLALSPFSGEWMSFVDPALARQELGFRHEPLAAYLDKIVTSFLRTLRPSRRRGYDKRDVERRLAGV
jgi:hypothetical protein